MKEGWEYKTLGEITTSINGLWKGKKEPFVNIGVIRNANFTKEITLDFSNIVYLDVEEKQFKARQLQKGDLIVEKSGGSEKQPVGRTVLFNEESGSFSVSNFTSILRINKQNEIIPEFLYKYLLYIYREGKTKEMQNAATGIHNIIYDKFLSIQVPISPLSEQHRIVEYLDTQFAKIDALKTNAEQQLQAAKDLFQSALKDLMTPKEGWKMKNLGEVGVFSRGGNFTKSDFVENGIPCIHYGQIHMRFGVTTEKCLTYLPYDFPKIKYAQTGDLIIAITSEDDEGSCKCTAWLGKENVAVGGHIAVFHHQLDPVFMSYFFMSPSFQKDKLEFTHGFKVVEIKPCDIAKIKIAFPTMEGQKGIVQQLDKINVLIENLKRNYEQTLTLCNDLKQSLLKKIFE